MKMLIAGLLTAMMTLIAPQGESAITTPELLIPVPGQHSQTVMRPLETGDENAEKEQSGFIPGEPANDGENERKNIAITIGSKSFPVKLYAGESSAALEELLPMTMEMGEMNGNEKYYFLESPLPSSPESPEQIHAGDIMLYGDNCIVLFYKDFSSAYRYTRLGHVEDVTEFAEAVGNSDVQVQWEVL